MPFSSAQSTIAPFLDAVDMFAPPLFYDNTQAPMDNFDAPLFETLPYSQSHTVEVGGGDIYFPASIMGSSSGEISLRETMSHWASEGSH